MFKNLQHSACTHFNGGLRQVDCPVMSECICGKIYFQFQTQLMKIH